MNIVLYTDDLEPITDIKLPHTREEIAAIDVDCIHICVNAQPIDYSKISDPSHTYDPPPIFKIGVKKLLVNGVQKPILTTGHKEVAKMFGDKILEGQHRNRQERFQTSFWCGMVRSLNEILGVSYGLLAND